MSPRSFSKYNIQRTIFLFTLPISNRAGEKKAFIKLTSLFLGLQSCWNSAPRYLKYLCFSITLTYQGMWFDVTITASKYAKCRWKREAEIACMHLILFKILTWKTKNCQKTRFLRKFYHTVPSHSLSKKSWMMKNQQYPWWNRSFWSLSVPFMRN